MKLLGVNLAKLCHCLEERIWWSQESQRQQLSPERDLPTVQHLTKSYVYLVLSNIWGGTESPSSERKLSVFNQRVLT